MNNLLKAEFYKLAHHRSFWGLLICSMLLGSVLLVDGRTPGTMQELLNASLYNMPMLYFLVMIFAALFAGEDFENRTLQAFISAGHTRAGVFLAKTVSFLTAGILILAGPLMLHGLFGLIIFGGFGDAAMETLLPKCVLILTAGLAMGMLPLLAAFVFKDIGRTAAVPIALFFIMIFILNGDNSKRIAVALPMGQLRLLSLNELPEPEPVVIGMDILWIVFLYLGAYCSFRKAELK